MRTWKFDPSANQLRREDEIATLSGKAADVLHMLVRHRGSVLSREDILDGVWKNVTVTPDLVREYVFDLRQALGDDAANPRYIETIRGKGFRLLGGVDLALDRVPGTALRRARIAVLRPDCFDGGPTWQRFADGMADELITDLARFNDIAVIARTSAFAVDKKKPIEAIAGALACDFLLDSGLSVWEKKLRVRFQLVDGRSGEHVWSESIDRGTENLPKVSGEIALGVANKLGGIAGAIIRAERRYAGRRPASELSAWHNYVIACDMEMRYDDESIRKGLEHIDMAIELDPEFARSHILRGFLCEQNETLVAEREKEVWLERAHEAGQEAVALDRRDPLALAFAARTNAVAGRIEEARLSMHRAADLSENESHAALLAASGLTLVLGDFNAADRLIQAARSLDPDPPSYFAFVEGRNLLFSGQYEEAENASFSGPEFESTFVIRCLAQALIGKTQEARRTHNELVARYPGFRLSGYPKSMGIVADNVLATFEEAVTRLDGLNG